ncbi:general stress protein, partial [Turicibacter sanguinis]|nr:general stress protein [Turicibacter sanguinis]
IGEFIDVKVLKFNSESLQARLSLRGVANNNYRYNRMKASDFETSNGFAPLAQQLPIWIRDSLEKIARVNKED